MIKEAVLYEKLRDKKIHCYLCVNQYMEGVLYTLVYGDVIVNKVNLIPDITSYSETPY